ncbi:hypothetical protein [Mesonia maritima]|uniref:Uncharacterized protein n=1 Tax=Mesonia maritima TaxID=1793873 RepID=A0ABU1K4F1_9FLAO|nr:hypothetical protein [Mesonia maritima]MDR6300495.1 hypothetical protein [Mesonia maritima]
MTKKELNKVIQNNSYTLEDYQIILCFCEKYYRVFTNPDFFNEDLSLNQLKEKFQDFIITISNKNGIEPRGILQFDMLLIEYQRKIELEFKS